MAALWGCRIGGVGKNIWEGTNIPGAICVPVRYPNALCPSVHTPKTSNSAPRVRSVGLPGDTIAVRRGRLFLNGVPQKEPYTNKNLPDRSFYAKTTVPKGHVFVMGDNRGNSADSRVFGPLPKKNIEGEAFLRFWPPHRIGLL